MTNKPKSASLRVEVEICTDKECGCDTPCFTEPIDALRFLSSRFKYAGVGAAVAESYARDIDAILAKIDAAAIEQDGEPVAEPCIMCHGSREIFQPYAYPAGIEPPAPKKIPCPNCSNPAFAIRGVQLQQAALRGIVDEAEDRGRKQSDAAKDAQIASMQQNMENIYRELADQGARLKAVEKDTERLDAIANECWKLDCFSRPTPGGDDADVGWRVTQYHMGKPKERTVAEVYTDDPRRAIDAAIANSKGGA